MEDYEEGMKACAEASKMWMQVVNIFIFLPLHLNMPPVFPAFIIPAVFPAFIIMFHLPTQLISTLCYLLLSDACSKKR